MAAANGGKDVKLRFFLCFSSYAFILVDFLHFPSHPSVFVRPTHTGGRFPANQWRPTMVDSLFLFLNSGESFLSILLLVFSDLNVLEERQIRVCLGFGNFGGLKTLCSVCK